MVRVETCVQLPGPLLGVAGVDRTQLLVLPRLQVLLLPDPAWCQRMAEIVPFNRSTPEPEPTPKPVDAIKRGDLRQSKKALCDCGYMWWAPVIGKCPRCKREGAKIVHEQELDYKRV